MKKFEKLILSSHIKAIDQYTIKRLYFGESNNGLIYLINESPSYITTSNLFSLLAKLLDYEKSIFAEAFNYHFSECSIEQIKEMKLDNHIKYQTANEVNDGLFIVDQYLNTCLSNGLEIKIEDILINQDCIQKYGKWKKSNIAEINSPYK